MPWLTARRCSTRPVRKAPRGRVARPGTQAGARRRRLPEVVCRHPTPAPHDPGVGDELERGRP
eukprot:8913951-Lingulodinium_polyedra.AAC.1